MGKIPAFPPKKRAEEARDLAVAQLFNVNFARRGWSETAIPQECEQRALAAVAEAVRAFAANSRMRCGLSDVARASECIEEVKLAFSRPAVSADSSGFVG